MRYCVTLCLKVHQKYDRLKLKVWLLSSKFRLFNFDLWYFWYPLRCRVIKYLIWKLSYMVKMGKEGLVERLLLYLFGGFKNSNLLHKWGLVETQLFRTVLCSITFWRLHVHKWKVCRISWPFTCRLTQMYTSIKSEFSWPFFGQLPPKCVPSTLLYYIWKIEYTQEESL